MTNVMRKLYISTDMYAWMRNLNSGRTRFLLSWIAPAVIAVLVLASLTGSTGLSAEHRVKAAFLYNFAKFINWPNNNSSTTFQFCIVGNGPLNTALETISGKTVRGRTISVRQVSIYDKASGCHMLFVSESGAPPSKEMFDLQAAQGVVTVGEGEPFVRSGGMIGFMLKRDPDSTSNKARVGFAINMDVARRAGVQISSELLKLATVLQGEW